MAKFFGVLLSKPRSEKRKVLTLKFIRQGEEASPRLPSAPRRTTMARPAVSSRVVDQVIKGEFAASLDVAQCDDIDSVGTETQVDVGVARVVEVTFGATHEIKAAVDERAMLWAFAPLGSKR
jgi:hypothetical protein